MGVNFGEIRKSKPDVTWAHIRGSPLNFFNFFGLELKEELRINFCGGKIRRKRIWKLSKTNISSLRELIIIDLSLRAVLRRSVPVQSNTHKRSDSVNDETNEIFDQNLKFINFSQNYGFESFRP